MGADGGQMSGKGAALAPLPYITYEARPWCALIGHVDALRASFVYARVRVHHRALDHCMYMQPARKMRTVARTGSATADLKPSHGVSQWPGGLANFKGGWGSVRVLPPVSPPKSAAPCAGAARSTVQRQLRHGSQPMPTCSSSVQCTLSRELVDARRQYIDRRACRR